MKDNIIGLVLGIRFVRSFRVSDISGDIMDHILNSDQSPFGPSIFPHIQENSRREKTLYNYETSEYLRINTDDIILGFNIEKNFETKYAWLKNEVLPYFKDHLMLKYKINNITRIGIVFIHRITKNNKINESIGLLTNNVIKDVENVSVSFSKKAATTEALYRKNVNDYKNVIYNFVEIENELQASLDYQYYYLPAVADMRECSSEKVLDDAKYLLENSYYSWLDKYEIKQNK